MWKRRVLAIIAALLVLLIGFPRTLAQPAGYIKYYGDVLIPNKNSSSQLEALEAETYRIYILAKISGNGLFNLIKHNSTFNAVLINGTNVTFVLRKSSSIYQPARHVNTSRTSNLTKYGLAGPFLVRISQGKILEVSKISNSVPQIELIEAKVGEEARALIEGKNASGFWYDGLNGWVFHLNWTQSGNLSAIIIHKNGTIVPFRAVLHALDRDISFNMSGSPYKWVHIFISNGSIELDARSITLPAVKQVDMLPIGEFFGFYKYNSSVFLIHETKPRHLLYNIVTPEKCKTCIIGGTTYVVDTSFKLNIKLDMPSEGIGGSSIPLTVYLPENVTNATLYVPGKRAVILNRLEVPYRLTLPLPPVNAGSMGYVYLTAYSSNGVYGLRESLKIIKAYEARLLNETRIFLVGGRGNLHVSVANFAAEPISLTDAQMNLTTKKGEVLSLKFPLSMNLRSNSSQRIILPLNLPTGDYEATLSLDIRDRLGHMTTIYIGEISIVSTERDPLNTVVTLSPATPNVGDNVKLRITITSMIPLSEILVSTNASSNLEPVSETSKVLKEISEGSTKKLSFLFKAKNIGPAKISVLFYYRIKGESFQRFYTKEIKVPIGGVPGKASVKVSESKVKVGEKITIDVKVEDIFGNLTVELPRELAIIEANGRIKGNSIESTAPGEIKVVGAFKESGEYTLPTYVLVNESLLVPSNTITVKVIGKSNVGYLEKDLRSKLADLMRRYKTLKETSGGLSPDEKRKLDLIGKSLEEIESSINKGEYDKASKMLSSMEDEISSMEEHAFSSLDQIMSGFIYFLIGAGIASAFLLAIKLRKGEKHGS